jgi:aspartate aminotransferase-like enzyme
MLSALGLVLEHPKERIRRHEKISDAAKRILEGMGVSLLTRSTQ